MLHGYSVVICENVVICWLMWLCVCMVLRIRTFRAFLLWLILFTVVMVYCPVHRAMIAGGQGVYMGAINAWFVVGIWGLCEGTFCGMVECRACFWR